MKIPRNKMSVSKKKNQYNKGTDILIREKGKQINIYMT